MPIMTRQNVAHARLFSNALLINVAWRLAGAAEPGGAHAPTRRRHLSMAGQLAEGTAPPASPAKASALPPVQAAGVLVSGIVEI